ncbi:MAG: hypothetical protein ACR2MG_12825 [Pyrinomonadaceae bacterium]
MRNKLPFSPRNRNQVKKCCILIILFIVLLAFSCKDQNPTGTNTDTNATAAPVKISPEIPVDVDPAVQATLKKEGDIYQLNEKFNENSWQSFVAIFYPRDKDGKPMPKFTDEGKATWLGWKESFQVYRCDGSVPTPWGSKRTDDCLKDSSIVDDTDARLLLSSNTPTHRSKSKNIADETDQAFAGKLFDQNGNVVVYEVLMNEAEFDYLVTNKLYNINGQIDFSKNGTIANFPAGDYSTNKVGAIEIKFAWKILTENDHKERYFQSKGYVVDEKTQKLVKKDLGMIGFHISQKTPTGSQWVWSTFEQIDNLAQNVIEKDGKKTVIHPSLTDPDCEMCPVNIDVTNHGTTFAFNKSSTGDYWTVSGDTKDEYYASSNVMKTQAKRMVAIPARVRQINDKMQAYFKSQNSVFQYYQLIDTQYPLDQKIPPAPNPGMTPSQTPVLPQSVVNKPGGNPNLAFLTNISMETFFQNGNQTADNFVEADNVPSPITVFGTESCMSCHSSAGIYNGISNGKFVTGNQLSGDFSWLLSQKAHWDKLIPVSFTSPVHATNPK